MYLTKKTIVAIIAAACGGPMALALPANETEMLFGWAQFCNDDACSEGCGISVDITNPGCLNQNGRRSIKFHGTRPSSITLVGSPGPDCPCQSHCETISTSNECLTIPQWAGAQSFRFQSESCAGDNC